MFESIRGSKEYKALKRKILKRDNYCCQMPGCKKRRKKLYLHHIRRVADCPSLALDEKNCIILCWHCHQTVDKKEDFYAPLFDDIVSRKYVSNDNMIKILMIKYGK